jgi:outer membrane receptor protein involved in Fe transport
VRFERQVYDQFETHTLLSPRFNLRYDFRQQWSLYGSLGRFTQPQRVDEWRLEEAQHAPDRPEVATHSVLGVAFEGARARVSLEAYRKHWSHVRPYFDNQLDRLSLVPDLQPDRVRIAPLGSEAQGVELNAHYAWTPRLDFWGGYTWSQVQDELGGTDVPRSWDQPQAIMFGTAWHTARTRASALLAWHEGWPSTPVGWLAGGQAGPTQVRIGARNSIRWENYLTLDLRVEWTIPLGRNEWSAWADVTNVANHANPCCFRIQALQGPSSGPEYLPGAWLPRILNVGFVWRVRDH